MSDNITLPSNVGNPIIDTFTRVEGVDTVHMQAVVPVDPITGEPNGATELTQTSLKEINDTLLVLLSAIVERMPRLGLADRLLVELGESTALPGLGTVTTVTGVNSLLSLGTTTAQVTKAADGIPTHLSNAGSMHIYNNIIVS